MIAEIIKKIMSITVLVMLCSVTQVLAISDDNNQAYRSDESQTDITTLATIDGESYNGQFAPVIKVMWEYDNDIHITDYNKYDLPACLYHDAAPCIDRLQVRPNIGSTVTVGYYAVVTYPYGIDPNPEGLGYVSVYADIWHPDGQFKYQIQLYPEGWNEETETYSKSFALNVWNHAVRCHGDLIKVNDNWAHNLSSGINWVEDVYDELNEEIALLYYTTAEISYCQPGGYYHLGDTAFDKLGYQADYLYDDYWYIPASAVEIDFNQIDYSPIHVGIDKTVGGDQDMTTPNKPTVRNIGNTPIRLSIWQDDMDFGKTGSVWNVGFDARLGAPGVNEDVVYSPFENVSVWPGVCIPGILPLCTQDKLDFSIHVYKGVSGYTYQGLMKLYAFIDWDSYTWITPSQFVDQPPLGVPDYNLTRLIASFNYYPQNPKTNDMIKFTDTSIDTYGTIMSWSWNFDDGVTSNIQNPEHIYADNGTYFVTLTVTDNFMETDIVSKTINISPSNTNYTPKADFTYIPLNPTTEDNITFTDTSTDLDGTIVSWSWDFNDGATSTMQNPTHKFSLNGNYSVTLLVTDDDSAIDIETKIIKISETTPPPSPDSPNPPDSPSSPGSSGSSDQDLLLIDKDLPPKAETNGPYNGFIGTPVTFDGSASNDSDGNITIYSWDFGDQTNGTGKIIDHTYNKVGNFTVQLTVTDEDGNSDMDTTYSNINERPNKKPTANFSYSPLNPKTDNMIQFTDSSIDYDGAIVSYFWNFSDGTYSSEKNPNHKFENEGAYEITLKVTDDHGAIDITTKTILVDNIYNINVAKDDVAGGSRGILESYGLNLIVIIALGAIVLLFVWIRKTQKI